MTPRKEIPIWAVFPMIFLALISLLICVVGPIAAMFEIMGHVRDLGWPAWLGFAGGASAMVAIWGVFGTTAAVIFRELFS